MKTRTRIIAQTETPDTLVILSWLPPGGTPPGRVYAEFRSIRTGRQLDRIFGEECPWPGVRAEVGPKDAGATREIVERYRWHDDLLVVGFGKRVEATTREAWDGTLILVPIDPWTDPARSLMDALAEEIRTIRLRDPEDPRRRIRIGGTDRWNPTITPLRGARP